MKRKINLTFCFYVIFLIIITLTISLYVFNNIFKKYVYKDIKTYATKITESDILNNSELIGDEISFSNIRVTLIDKNGIVLYDSETDPSQMENHSDREEFKEAISNGNGTALRNSKTVGKSTYYYAVKLDNGDILRIAKEASNITPLFMNALKILIPVAIILIIISLFISTRLTKRIIKPIEVMTSDLENVEQSSLYDELIPFAKKIKEQQNDINRSIQQLRKENEKIQLITKSMSEGIVFLDENKNIISLNDSATGLLKLRDKNYVGHNILNAIRNNEILSSIERAAKGESNFIELQVGARVLQVFSNPIIDNNNVAGIICIILDVTEKFNRDRMRREFTANVSHELKTPLTAISGYSELIEYNIAKKEDVADFAAKIHNEALRLLTLINDIIKLSELDEGLQSEDFKEINLLNLVEQCVNSLDELANRSKVNIKVNGEETIVYGNSSMLYELIYNLVDNAIRYNKDNGIVEIEVKKEQKKVILSVKDTGIGIPAEYRERVFERFFRVDKSRSKATGGTGLGLSIVKHIANVHHAEIECKSKESVGTQIKVIFKI